MVRVVFLLIVLPVVISHLQLRVLKNCPGCSYCVYDDTIDFREWYHCVTYEELITAPLFCMLNSEDQLAFTNSSGWTCQVCDGTVSEVNSEGEILIDSAGDILYLLCYYLGAVWML